MFDIKKQQLNENSRYKQGYFDRYNPAKYRGKRPIVYRSSYELAFMRKMEINNAVEWWSSETVVIPYLMKVRKNGKWVQERHNYYMDFTVHLRTGETILCEVKPSSFVPLNESQILRNPENYKNACKWKAAIAYCKANGLQFRIITEKHLQTKIF